MSGNDTTTAARQNPNEVAPDQKPWRFLWYAHWRDLLLAIQSIHGLVAARVPLAEGLLNLSQDVPNRVLRQVFYWLHRELKGGLALHEAMGNRPDFFPPFCVNLVRAGEDSGQLAETLDDLQQDLAEDLAFHKRVAAHTAYFILAVCLPYGVIAAMSIYVAPQILALIESLDSNASPLLDWAMALHVSGLGYYLLGAMILVPVAWMVAAYSQIRGGVFAEMASAIGSRVPVLGGLSRRKHLARDAAILGRLLKAGAPLSLALRVTAEASSLGRCRAAFLRMAGGVENGCSLREAMAQERAVLPSGFRSMVALGERAGELPESLLHISRHYRSQTMHVARLSVEIGAPLLVCLSGALVFVVYGGFFSALLELIEVVQ